MAYRANVGGMFGSGINQKPQTGLSIDVAPVAGIIAQALASRRDGLIHKAMLQRQFEQQDAAAKAAEEQRQYERATAEDERNYTRTRNAAQDSLAEAKQAEETAAKRAELGIIPDHYAPVMDPVSPVSDFRVPTIRSAMMANVGQFGGGAPKTGLALPRVPSVGAIPKMQLVSGYTDPTLGTRDQARRQALVDARDTHAANRLFDVGHPMPPAPLRDPRQKAPVPTPEAVAQDVAYSAIVAADGNVDKAIGLVNSNPTDAKKAYGMTRRQFEDAAKRYRLHLKQSHRSVEDVQQTPGAADVSPATDGGGDITLPETGAINPAWIEHARQNPDYAAYLKANGVAI